MVEEAHLARYRYACAFVRGKDVLDLACGTGYGSFMLAEAGARSVLGIDLSEEAISHAIAKYSAPSLRYTRGNAQALDSLPSSSIDIVVSFETIEHLPEPSKYALEVWRVLRDEGLYIVSTPDRRLSSPRYPLRRRPDNPWHLHEFTGPDFQAFLVGAGFEVVDVHGQAFVPAVLAFWPVQFTVKAVCSILKAFGARRFRERLYDIGSGLDLQRRTEQTAVANFWVTTCKKVSEVSRSRP